MRAPLAAMILLAAVCGKAAAAECPSLQQVEASATAVAGVAPAGGALAWHREESDLVVIVAPTGGHVVQRHFPLGELSCDELARAIAIVWAAVELGTPELEMDLPMPPEAPALVQDPPDLGKRQAAPASDVRVIEAGRVASTYPRRIEAEFAALAAWTGQNATAALQIAGRAGFTEAVGLRLAVGYQGQIQQEVGTGLGQWTRWTVGFGPTRRWLSSRWMIDVEAAGLAAHLQISGSRFERNASGGATDWGGRAAARGAWRLRHLTPFVLLQADGWVGTQRLRVENVPAYGEVSRFTVAAGLGVLWGHQ